MNRRSLSTILVFSILILLSGCRSEFEKIRASGDTELVVENALKYYEAEEYLRAQTLMELVINSVRGLSESEEIYFKYAYTHYNLNNYVLAAYYFKNFRSTFPNSEYREEADFMEAYSYFKQSPSFRLDQTNSRAAIEGFQLFANTYPNSSRVEECNTLIDRLRRKLEQKAFDQAVLYYDLKQYQSATHAFENLLKDFPESPDVERVRYLMAKASYLLAENSVFRKKAERYEEAIDYATNFSGRYDSSKFLKEINDILEDSDKKLKSLR
ncbi:MAG: outer membrane protein assembly factor BamD [Saprospiraceae bacterium]|nr:outer membrane protein assembly factor BamD [Saprospiraceae bacterium]